MAGIPKQPQPRPESVRQALSKLSERRPRELADRPVDSVIQLGGSLGVLTCFAIVVCAVLVAVGVTFISGTEVLEAAVFTVVYSGIIAGAYAVFGRSRTAPTRPVITTEERLAAARAAALSAALGQQQRLEGALELEALAQVRLDLAGPAAQAFKGLVLGSDIKPGRYRRRVVLAALQALSRLNPLLREQGLVVDLRGASLAGMDLSGLNLRGADLTGADLTESTLAGTDLAGAILTGAMLDYANLSEADLAYAYLQGASFYNAILATAHLEGTYLPSTAKGLR
jgi:pentapeptide repeat protein